jgi:hypothetical protein
VELADFGDQVLCTFGDLHNAVMAFSFGFSGDDIDLEDSEINNDTQDVVMPNGNTNSLPELVKASKHDMDGWVSFEVDNNTLLSFSNVSYGLVFHFI